MTTPCPPCYDSYFIDLLMVTQVLINSVFMPLYISPHRIPSEPPPSPQAFVEAGVLETIVDGMDRFRQEWHLQVCSCEAISVIVAALPGRNPQPLDRVLEVGAHRAVGRASRW